MAPRPIKPIVFLAIFYPPSSSRKIKWDADKRR
jgi:hypothetical protein